MNGSEVIDVARDSILTLVLVASPLMLVGLAVGVPYIAYVRKSMHWQHTAEGDHVQA